MTRWHPTAIIDAGAEIADDVEIGPYCTVGPHVRIGSGSRLISHVTLDGHATLADNNLLYPFVAIGYPPQMRGAPDSASRIEIGSHNVMREHVTMHTGSSKGSNLTRVGSHGLFMVGTHVAHDCVIGNHVILANGAQVGGHAVIEDHAQIGALAGVHQFVRIGCYAFVGGCSAVEKHVIPFALATGNRAWLRGLNIVGLQRGRFSKSEIDDLRKAYGLLFSGDELLSAQVSNLERELQDSHWVARIVRFYNEINGEFQSMREVARRGMCLPRDGRL